MPMRRGNGDGSIIKIKNKRLRKPYLVQVCTGGFTASGSYKRTPLGYFRTRLEAEAFLNNFLHKGISVDRFNCTLGQVYQEWNMLRERQKEAGTISYSAAAGSKAAWLKLQVLADKRMRDICTFDLQAVIDACNQSHSSLEKLKSLMTMLWNYAIQNDIIDKNYATFVVLPANNTKERDAFHESERQALKEAAAAGVPWADAILMLCYTGFRINEFLSLEKKNITLENNKVTAVTGGSKTEAGKNRTVPVSPIIEPYFTKWYHTPGNFLISQADGERYSVQKWRTECYHPALEAMNAGGWEIRRLTPHCTRHTFATLCEIAGLSPVTIEKLMGHTDYKMSKKYTHVEMANLASAVERLE